MTDLKKIFEYIKSNIVIVLLIIYSISFINYYVFYKSFNISIFSYVGLNDLIFFPLEYAFKILLIVILCDFAVNLCFGLFWYWYERIVFLRKKKVKLYLTSDKKNRERLRNVFNEPYKKHLMNARFSLIFLGIFVIILLPNILLTFPSYFIYLIYIIELYSEEKSYNFSVSFAIAIVFISMIITTLNSSYSKRFNKDEYFISFKEDGEFITTEKGLSFLNYLGETSSCIFLYDINKRKSKVYQKSLITNIEIQNTNTIDNYILKIKELYPVRILIEMNNEE